LHFRETSPGKEANIVYAGAEAVAAATLTLLFLLAVRLPEGQQGVFRATMSRDGSEVMNISDHSFMYRRVPLCTLQFAVDF
jgi:hypothetical protein